MNSRRLGVPFFRIGLLLLAGVLNFSARSAYAQVSPNEILNPDLKALEKEYFPQLKSLNQTIAKTKFPFPLYLSRLVGIDPAQQAGADSRGLEFVRFKDRVLLKTTGNYNAAYNSKQLTQNERATQTFRNVILPVLNHVTAAIPPDINCDGFGFEISYHTRTRDQNYDYEGKEILVVVLDRGDAFALAQAESDADRQEILNRSHIYVNGAEFGLSLTEHDPLDVQALPRSVPSKIDASSTVGSSTAMNRARIDPKLITPPSQADAAVSTPALNLPKPAETKPAVPAPTQADADRLDEKYQAQLAALSKVGVAKFHFVDYSPPAFVIFGNQTALQMTLRNSLRFGPDKGSIYKRAALSFDLFLAPKLKDLLENIPADMEFQAFDFAVLNQLAPGTKGTNEAIEFICPRAALRQFANAEITNQQLIDQSVVLVNGVRIALNLQLVE